MGRVSFGEDGIPLTANGKLDRVTLKKTYLMN